MQLKSEASSAMATTGTKAKPQNEYGTYHVPEGLEGRPAAKAVLSGVPYEPDTLKFMRANAGDGDIIHAGMFFGDFLPALSTALAKNAQLWGFEPNPGNFEAAEKTAKMNKLKNANLFNAALSNTSGQILFKTKDDKGKSLGGLSHFVQEDGDGVEAVDAMMLDYVVPLDRKVSILQLDVEGHEKEAMKGAYHIINRWKPILVLEYFGQLHWINRNFRGLGYERIGKLHGNHVYAVEGSGISI
ncbi:FkbM family methyltransferase [Thalassococcus lentus]|uniref:FkbM family methyltransferase n=1 Tax=Thalassococcus lentus TaxID=1210524 RepID=A0ABT4XNF4_9RHOB|nr:FkbM family methyltransferase [Thalassococcus lentus]MDA7423466.1 FkbM family methyltransferase [Thalassococcus lentus]